MTSLENRSMFSCNDGTLSPAEKLMMKLETPRAKYWCRSDAICSGLPCIIGRDRLEALAVSLKITSVLNVRSTMSSGLPA